LYLAAAITAVAVIAIAVVAGLVLFDDVVSARAGTALKRNVSLSRKPKAVELRN
jgi:hypothetical protein